MKLGFVTLDIETAFRECQKMVLDFSRKKLLYYLVLLNFRENSIENYDEIPLIMDNGLTIAITVYIKILILKYVISLRRIIGNKMH